MRTEDAHLLPGRIGHADRKQAVQHIARMQETGHLSADEAVTRQNQAAAAQTRAELNELTRDLPAPEDTRGLREKWDWNEPRYYIPFLVTGIFLSVLLPVITWGILTVNNIFDASEGVAIFYPVLAAGVFGFFLSAIFLIVKVAKD
jgi:hypothetical protein